jgi:hypothetical protein
MMLRKPAAPGLSEVAVMSSSNMAPYVDGGAEVIRKAISSHAFPGPGAIHAWRAKAKDEQKKNFTRQQELHPEQVQSLLMGHFVRQNHAQIARGEPVPGVRRQKDGRPNDTQQGLVVLFASTGKAPGGA